MKHMITIVAIVGALAILPAGLKEAIEQGLLRSADFRSRVLEEKTAQLETEISRMKRYFSLNSGALYMFKSERMEITLPGKTMAAGAKHNYDLNVSLEQPIFTGHRLTQTVNISRLQQAAAHEQTLMQRIETAAGIKTSYFKALVAHKERVCKFYG